MSSSVFLAAFLGCLFALAFVALALWYIASRFFGRNLADILRHTVQAHPEAAAEIAKVARDLTSPAPSLEPAPVTSASDLHSLEGEAVCHCGRIQSVPPATVPSQVHFLVEIGWRVGIVAAKSDMMITDLWCPFCVAHEAPEAPEVAA